MIKVTYYIGMNDKDSLKQELTKVDFIHEFDRILKDYTLQEAQGRFTHKNGRISCERTLIVTTFIDECQELFLKGHIQSNCDAFKEALNQESILVEVTEPGVLFC